MDSTEVWNIATQLFAMLPPTSEGAYQVIGALTSLVAFRADQGGYRLNGTIAPGIPLHTPEAAPQALDS